MTAVVSVCDALRRGNIAGIEDWLKRDVVNEVAFTRTQIADLWEAGWESWEAGGQDKRITLGAFMASMKAAHPWLPSVPVWTTLTDVEEE